MQMRNHDNNYDARISPVIKMTAHEAQNDKMVRGTTPATDLMPTSMEHYGLSPVKNLALYFKYL